MLVPPPLLGCCQIATRVADIYVVPMPSAVASVLSTFDALNLSLLRVGLPLQCLGLGSFEQQVTLLCTPPLPSHAPHTATGQVTLTM